MNEQNDAAITVYDLKTLSVFKIAYFSVLGVNLAIALMSLVAYGAGWFSALIGIELGWGELVAGLAGNLVIGPALSAVYLIFGNWVWKKIQPNAADIQIEFTSSDTMFHALTPDTIYRVLTFCMKGFVVVFGVLLGLFLLVGLLFSGLDGWQQTLGIAFLSAVVLTFVPYIWAYIYMLGSYVTKGITNAFGWGRIETR